MADITKRGPDCDDEGERGERGRRGHRGHDGATGPTGPTGPAGFTTEVVFRPGDPAGTRANIFVTWTEAYAATQAVPGHGPLDLVFDDTFAPVSIPAGVWAMDNVRWTNVEHGHEMTLTLDDGASIVLDNPDLGLRIKGFGLKVISDRKGPIAPFVGLRVICEGMFIRFLNTDSSALPMFESGPGGFALLLFSGQNTISGLGDFQTDLLAPVVDAQGGFFFMEVGAGWIGNNAFTDTVGGGFVDINVLNDTAIGNGLDEFSFPALIAGGGVLEIDVVTNHNRHLVDPQFVGSPVTPAMSPYAASYNEIVFVDTTAGPVVVNAPTATPAKGERFTVKDVGGNAVFQNITILPTGTNSLDGGLIQDNNGSKTWVCDGLGNWWLTSAVP